VTQLDDSQGKATTGFSRAQVAQALEASDEHRVLVIQGLYQKLLHRSASDRLLADGVHHDPSTEVGMWLAHYPGQAQLEADILGSSEYFSHRGGLSNVGFLDAVYRDVLGRPLDLAGAQTWLPQLPAAAQEPAVIDAQGDLSPDTAVAGRTAVAGQVVQSAEADGLLVAGLYQQLLHRSPDTPGLQAFVTGMQPRGAGGSGETVEIVEAALVGSDEYFGHL
jgi:hypothetical protein